jgi:hypothetical protein
MLIPQFTLRRLLVVIAACAAFFLVVGSAVAGSKWALAVSVAIAWLVGMLGVYAGAFFIVWLVSLMPFGRRRLAHARSPFQQSMTPAPANSAAGGSPFASTQGGELAGVGSRSNNSVPGPASPASGTPFRS